jgi:putative colanic acid biosynthesis acetyltransferase WcaF
VSIGEYSWIGDNAVLYSLGEIEIGNNTVISQRCYLCTASHKYDDPSFPIYSKKITIGSECWLATDVYVAPGISINNSCVVGARSSVFANLDSKKVYIGSPAKYLKER